jgi:hypothetical protein
MKQYFITLSEENELEEMLADGSSKSIFVIGMGDTVNNFSRMQDSFAMKFRNRAEKLWNEILKRKEDPDRMFKDWNEIEVSQFKRPLPIENSINLEKMISTLADVQNIKEIIFHSIDLEYFPKLYGSFANVERIEFTDSTVGYFKDEMSEESSLRTIYFDKSFLKEFPSHLHIFPKLEHFLFNGNIGFRQLILKSENLILYISLFDLNKEEIFRLFNINYEESNDHENLVKILNRARLKFLKLILADEIGLSLRGLRSMYSSMQFRKLPKTILFGRKMKTLSIRGTLCKKIPESLFFQNQLRRIDLSDNAIRTLPKGMIGNEKILYLDLSENDFKIDEEFIAKINSFKNLRYLKVDLYIEDTSTQEKLIGKRLVRKMSSGYFGMSFLFDNLGKEKNVERLIKFLENRRIQERESYSTKFANYYCYFISRYA